MALADAETMSETTGQDFGEFYEEWFARVYNYARHRTGSATRADEIVSDTFSRVFEAWKRFDPEKGDRRTWLFAIAFRAVADHYRSEKRRYWYSLGLLARPAERDPGPAEELEQDERQRRLLAALDTLSAQHREIVALKFFAAMTNRDIARLVGLGESNVAVILFRSVRRMRLEFPAGEGDHG